MDTSSISSPPSSLVSRARTAFHSAAAKAEKVLTDLKPDRGPDPALDLGARLRRRFPVEVDKAVSVAADGDRNLGSKLKGRMEEGSRGKSKLEFSGKNGLGEVNDANVSKSAILPVSVVRQLAMAIESGMDYSCMNDLLDLTGGSYLVSERAALTFSAVKSLVLREKDKSDSEILTDEENHFLVSRLFSSEEHSSRCISASVSMDLKDIHGAPIGSFVVRAAEIIGSLKSLHKIASFWVAVMTEIKRLWSEGKPIPHVPLDEKPDLNCCLLYQQLQVINCCIARKERRALAVEALDAVIGQNHGTETVDFSQRSSNSAIYAKTKTGEYVLRLGADQPFENLTMLESDETIYSPITQEAPILTEEHIREAEEFVLRTGSLGAGCSQLLSDMQAFKAANPGCILEDFIRWHSPPDWLESVNKTDESPDASTSKKGQLSRRMQKEGNLWHELWETAKALPAVRQTPLFDEDLAVESIFATLDEISPSVLFHQLFVSILSSSFEIAEAALSMESSLSKVFCDCKDYVIATCQKGVSKDNLNDLCKVYETVEMILLHPEDAIELTKGEETNSNERKGLFRKFGLSFIGRDRQNSENTVSKEQKKSAENTVNVFSNLFDGKKSLFSKKNKKPDTSELAEPLDDSSWTVL